MLIKYKDMKKINKFFLFPFSFILCAGTLASCDDFFEPETADALKGEAYMSSLTEMSTGYLGILTKMQAVGDKEIYLTDTRGDQLEPTAQSIAPLISLYNYDDDLTGNEYADPASYYDVVIACNDYIHKMVEFQHNYPELVKETDYFNGLLASAVRVKVWAYITMAEIYGQALWFDDPITSIKDVNDTNIFQLLKSKDVVDRCISLLKTPIYLDNSLTVSPNETFSWIAWVDPEHVTSIDKSSYRFWDMMTPDYAPLMAKLQIWKSAFLEGENKTEEAKLAYEAVLDNLLPYLQSYWARFTHYWKRCPYTPGHYSAFWNNATPYQEEVVSAIIYDYTKNQTNKLLYHFSNAYPNKFLLQASDSVAPRYLDPRFTYIKSTTEDQRRGKSVSTDKRIIKFRPDSNPVRQQAYQDDVHIYTFRVSELFLWLAESLNHLGRFEAFDKVLNNGFTGDYDMLLNLENGADSLLTEKQLFEYKGFNSYWALPTSVDKYGTYTGYRGCLSLTAAPIDTLDMKHNDELLIHEWMLDFVAEGKSYPNMIRMAERYQDDSLVVKYVTPKYGDRASEIAAKITAVNPESGLKGYYVPWNLKNN